MVPVHVIFKDPLRIDALKLIESAGLLLRPHQPFLEYGIAVGEIDESGISRLRDLPVVEAVEIDQVREAQ